MEENEVKKEKLSYEALEQMNRMLQNKCLELDNQLRNINMVGMRLNYLFNVLDRAKYFNEDFVNACAEEVQSILDTRGLEEETKSE